MNRHERRAVNKATGATAAVAPLKKRPVGYRGQRFEVRAGKYGDKKNFVIGWANEEAGVAAMVAMITKHPLMSDPQIIELDGAQKAALLNS